MPVRPNAACQQVGQLYALLVARQGASGQPKVRMRAGPPLSTCSWAKRSRILAPSQRPSTARSGTRYRLATTSGAAPCLTSARIAALRCVFQSGVFHLGTGFSRHFLVQGLFLVSRRLHRSLPGSRAAANRARARSSGLVGSIAGACRGSKKHLDFGFPADFGTQKECRDFAQPAGR